MFQSSEVCPVLLVSSQETSDQNFSIITFLNQSNTLQKAPLIENINQKSIYVCTFCQVFSPSEEAVVEHVTSQHKDSFLLGTNAKSYVSKLQALQKETAKLCPKKVGRPKKSDEKCVEVSESKPPPVDPTPRPDGLFWCEICHRFFRKSRQLTRHVCQQTDELSSLSEDMSGDSDESPDFQKYTVVDPLPWSRREKNCKDDKQLPSDNKASCKTHAEKGKEMPVNKMATNWRKDPTYVPLFQNENEKLAFEEHLKSVDYSYIDIMFEKQDKVIRKKGSVHRMQNGVFSCNICKKLFQSLSHIRMHCLTHTDIKPFTCPKCPYQTNSKGSLYFHMRKHTGNVFHCSYCDFTSIKRARIVDHEATHSSVPQICKLCKNSYKTVKSLMEHVRKYHKNAGGKKYLKSLSSKGTEAFIECSICHRKFKNTASFDEHSKTYHVVSPLLVNDKNIAAENVDVDTTENLLEVIDKGLLDGKNIEMIQAGDDVPCQTNVSSKDSLAAMVLDNLLQQKQSENLIYPNIFDEPSEESLLTPVNRALLENLQLQPVVMLENISQFLSTKSSILGASEKALCFDVLDECLRNSTFNNTNMVRNSQPTTLINTSALSNEQFTTPPAEASFTSNSVLQSGELRKNQNFSDSLSHLHQDTLEKKCHAETKSAETKLFEKCPRAPAYVCCVCSAIYICPSTLKVHLREHVNNTSSALIEQTEEHFESPKISEKLAETANEVDSVCGILQDSGETCSFDEKELEKLYTSSLDMMWYLPEVSVVLQNDPALFDSVLDDISNFPIDESSDLSIKGTDESVLKCFDEL